MWSIVDWVPTKVGSRKEMDEKDRVALEAFLVDNPDLESLEARISRFNLFEATGLVRHEIRHSHFLAFLLDPSQPHGLGDTFLKWLLQETLGRDDARQLHTLSPLRLHLTDLSGSVVRREWRNIDILVENYSLRVVVAIENKVGTGEHSDQLRRYRETLHREFPKAEHIVLILLSPGATAPSDGRYLPLGYGTIHSLLVKALDRLDSQLSPDVLLILRHYKELLATHVIDDPELDKLCDEIYRKHRRALDLIFERRKRPQAALMDATIEWVNSKSNLVFPDNVHPNMAKFVPHEWREFSPIVGEREGVTLRSLCVMPLIDRDRAQIWIEMHKGDDGYRRHMQSIVDRDRHTFPPKNVRRRDVNSVFFRKEVLTPRDFETEDFETLSQKLIASLESFLANDVPRFTEVFRRGLENFPTSSDS